MTQGKKGIALTADQFRKLKDLAEQLTRALQSSDVSCSHALGDM
jgi:Transcriptional Coactivator p15 (PC4)